MCGYFEDNHLFQTRCTCLTNVGDTCNRVGHDENLHNNIIEYESSHAKTCLESYVYSDGPDQSTHPRSLIRANIITKTRLFKYTENFTTKKGKFSDKKF